MAQDDVSVWKINGLAALHWKEWDGQYLLYEAASGDTHLMDEVGAAVFHCLIDSGGLEEFPLFHRVAKLLELEPDDALLDQVKEILQRFARNRLFERKSA